MNKRKTARIFNDLSMAFFLISSTVVAFLPIADREKHPAIAVLAGGIFWVGLLWGIFLYILSCQKIRNLKSYQNYRSVERIGALAPGSTKEGLIADLAFIPGFLVIILGTYVFNIPDPVMLVCMWITMVSFYGHFVLNGRVYKFLHKRKVIRYRKVKEESAEKNTQLKEGVLGHETKNKENPGVRHGRCLHIVNLRNLQSIHRYGDGSRRNDHTSCRRGKR